MFFWLFFILFKITFKIGFFYDFILSLFRIRFYHYFFNCYFFTLLKIFIEYFSSISFFNIKLVESWAILLNSGLEFHRLWEDWLRFRRFIWVYLIFLLFLSSYFFIFIFQHLIWLKIEPHYFFICFLYNFSLILKITWVISGILIYHSLLNLFF